MSSGSQELNRVRLTRTEANSLHLQLPVSHEQKHCACMLGIIQLNVNFTHPKKYYNYKLQLKVIGLIVQGGHVCLLRNLENASDVSDVSTSCRAQLRNVPKK